MAAQQHGSPSDFDMTPHQQTWNAFCKMIGLSMIGIILLLLFLLWIHFG